MLTLTEIQAIDWTTFNGSVTVLTPVSIRLRNGYPSRFKATPEGQRHVFEVNDAVFSHMVKGKDKPFAELIDGKLVKLSVGWCDTVGDYIVALLFSDLIKMQGDGPLPQSLTLSGVDVSDWTRNYIYYQLNFQFTNCASLADVHFILRPVA